MHHFAIVVLFIIAGYETVARSPFRVPPCICTTEYSPVCGTDGATYGNKCELGCRQGAQLDCQGPCPCSCICNTRERKSKKCETECAQSTNVCLQPKVTGFCEAYIPVWFYNVNTKQCEKFVYGGCQGNGNRFDSKEKCEGTCVKTQSQDPCKLPKVVGPCRAAIPRWYYDTKEADCKQFDYGGCDGNANNFESRQKCLDRC